jgi:transcriptional regulator with XRE-family HTH domain
MVCSTIEIGARIAARRKECGFSQDELAKKLCVSREVVAKWENGMRDIKTQYTVDIADALGITCDYLLRGVDTENVNICNLTGLSNDVINSLTDKQIIDGIISATLKGKADISFSRLDMPIINYLLNSPIFSNVVDELKKAALYCFRKNADGKSTIFSVNMHNDLKEFHIYQAGKYATDIFNSFISAVDAYHKENMLLWKVAGLVDESTHIPKGYYGEDSISGEVDKT